MCPSVALKAGPPICIFECVDPFLQVPLKRSCKVLPKFDEKKKEITPMELFISITLEH
jgi:hypothetical protein